MNNLGVSAAGSSSGSEEGSAPRRNSKRPKCNISSKSLFSVVLWKKFCDNFDFERFPFCGFSFEIY